MTDTPDRDPADLEPSGEPGGAEGRLPVPRPPVDPAPVERFTSPAPIRAVDLSPERAAQVVRQSSNARWVGFLAVVVVILFVAIYWFYELGGPLGLTEPRLTAEGDQQQVTAVERGYLIYEANCARCHGVDGLGPNDTPAGIGPALNRQDKLFAHLSEAYLQTILEVGGRYACGNPESVMPVWADSNGGPLNYRQIQELIAFIRAPSDQTYTVRDDHLFDPVIDPLTGEVETFNGWRDVAYEPAPGATPFPACWTDELTGGDGGEGGGEASPGPSTDPSAPTVSVAALNLAFTTPEVTVAADTPFTLAFDNQDPSIPHDVQIKDEAGTEVFKTETFNGVETRSYAVEGLAAGSYPFICTVHPTMTGTLTAE